MKRLMMALVGAMLAMASMHVSAKAGTVPLGDITGSSNDSFGGVLGFFQPATAFSDDVTFTLTADSAVSGNLSDLEVIFGPFSLLDISGLTATLNGNPLTLDGSGNFSIAGILAAGNYLISIAGTTAGFFGGAYHVTLSASTVTPIPGALLLFVTAIGGMAGFAGLRRKSAV